MQGGWAPFIFTCAPRVPNSPGVHGIKTVGQRWLAAECRWGHSLAGSRYHSAKNDPAVFASACHMRGSQAHYYIIRPRCRPAGKCPGPPVGRPACFTHGRIQAHGFCGGTRMFPGSCWGPWGRPLLACFPCHGGQLAVAIWKVATQPRCPQVGASIIPLLCRPLSRPACREGNAGGPVARFGRPRVARSVLRLVLLGRHVANGAGRGGAAGAWCQPGLQGMNGEVWQPGRQAGAQSMYQSYVSHARARQQPLLYSNGWGFWF